MRESITNVHLKLDEAIVQIATLEKRMEGLMEKLPFTNLTVIEEASKENGECGQWNFKVLQQNLDGSILLEYVSCENFSKYGKDTKRFGTHWLYKEVEEDNQKMIVLKYQRQFPSAVPWKMSKSHTRPESLHDSFVFYNDGTASHPWQKGMRKCDRNCIV